MYNIYNIEWYHDSEFKQLIWSLQPTCCTHLTPSAPQDQRHVLSVSLPLDPPNLQNTSSISPDLNLQKSYNTNSNEYDMAATGETCHETQKMEVW